MSRQKLNPEVALVKLLAVRLNERNYALVYMGARKAGVKISEFVNKLIKDNVKVRLPKQEVKKKAR